MNNKPHKWRTSSVALNLCERSKVALYMYSICRKFAESMLEAKFINVGSKIIVYKNWKKGNFATTFARLDLICQTMNVYAFTAEVLLFLCS